MSKNMKGQKVPGLISAIMIGVGCIIGSGWLFASYNAARTIGSMSFVSWVIGAAVALILALLLAEMATMYKERAFFARILTISHKNSDLGFVIAISSLLGLILVIPSEAAATVQYLSGIYPFLMNGTDLTVSGNILVFALIVVYGLVNYWGLQVLAKVNNLITFIKLFVPILVGLVLIIYTGWNGQFHMSNFSLSGFDQSTGSLIALSFTTVVTGGIFYSFYGFGMIAIFGSELKNPKRNIPLALVSCVLLCLLIYLVLQFAFIGSMPTEYLKDGWQNLPIFSSPLAQLLGLVGLNFGLVTILYLDSAISPSGTGAIYMGSSSRMITGMAQDKQLPSFFNRISEKYNISRRSLITVFIIGMAMTIFFKNWHSIMIIVTVFNLISCIAIPVALTKLRKDLPNQKRAFKVPFGITLSYFIFLILSYLMIQATMKAIIFALSAHLIVFAVYSISYYKMDLNKIFGAIASSWSIFAYLAICIPFSYLVDNKIFTENIYSILAFIVVYSLSFLTLVNQKNVQGLQVREVIYQ
ncbi:APC family permease [Thiotrichales bacterium 19S9-12]|nr:APC family permease [Thiotrichales bacterium 19S9-11]MCF6812083.1 APC family permease [Thiotrichales bacterium 19S9-12]